MKIFGYSERGMINSILYSMNNTQVKKFIALLSGDNIESILDDSIEILIEQSLSDFGDADIIIIYNKPNKTVLFVEAKVKTFSQKSWSLLKEYGKFKDINRNNNGSNLFRQLALKKELIDHKDFAVSGIEIPNKKIAGKKTIKKIGSNEVVLNAFKKINDAKDYHYIGIIPDREINIDSICLDRDDYYIKFIQWSIIHSFIENEKITNAQENFKFNYGQIF